VSEGYFEAEVDEELQNVKGDMSLVIKLGARLTP
jgi:hypothetical protein